MQKPAFTWHSGVSGRVNTFDKARLFCRYGIRFNPVNIGFLCRPGFILAALTPEADLISI